MVDSVKHNHNSYFHGAYILGEEIVKKEGKPTNKTAVLSFTKETKQGVGAWKSGRYALRKMLVAGITMNQKNSATGDFLPNRTQNMQIENSNRTYLALVIS